MAFAPLLPFNISLPLSSPPPSLLPTLRIRHPSSFNSSRSDAYLSPRCNPQPFMEDSSEANEIKNETQKRKKKKKRKLRPSFYDQTLDRWSVKISSQTSKFPWQKHQQSEEKGTLQSSLDDYPLPGKPINPSFRNHGISPPWAHGMKPRNAQLGSEAESRLGLIVEKLNGSLKHAHLDVNDGGEGVDTDGIACSSSFNIPSNSVLVAPWVHGAEAQEPFVGTKAETMNSPDIIIKRDEVDGKNGSNEEFSGSLNSNQTEPITHTSARSRDTKMSNFNKSTSLAYVPESEIPSSSKQPLGNGINGSVIHFDHEAHAQIQLPSLESNTGTGNGKFHSIVEKMKSALDEDDTKIDIGISSSQSDDRHVLSNSDRHIVNLMSSVTFPWERKGLINNGEQLRRRNNTNTAEKTIPEPELRRLRHVSLRMKERMKVGPAGVTEAVVERIREKWKEAEVVKLRFEGPPSMNMMRTHEILERKTGGLVIWRSGSSVVLYRGMTYKLPCAQSYLKLADTNIIQRPTDPNFVFVEGRMNDPVEFLNKPDADSTTSFQNPSKGSSDTSDIDSLLNQLGPRFTDWSGHDPLPVDADLLPAVLPDYKPPFRLLPYKTCSALKNREMTSLRRLARTMSPHFALGRNRQLQGLAKAMVMLWKQSAIAKIAIKRGVPNTCNDRMAEEIKKLTGGILLSRNKEYIVFYRGNDFLTSSIMEVLVEKQKLATIQHDKEEAARLRASALIFSDSKTTKGPLVAGTLAETTEASTRWGNQPSCEERERMKRDIALAKHASLVRHMEKQLALAKGKVRKAERALANVQEFLNPAELPTDLETVTDEERFLFRKIGLKMSSFFILGRREVFDGTIQNMHLGWKNKELVKIIVKGKNFAQVKHIAISLEAESGGVLISLDKTTKGYAIIFYRGKNYHRPQTLRPKNLLTKRQALARSIELQRREALNHHISNLRKNIQMLRSQLDQMEANRKLGNEEDLELKVDDALLSDDDMEDEGEEAYLETYNSGCEDDDAE